MARPAPASRAQSRVRDFSRLALAPFGPKARQRPPELLLRGINGEMAVPAKTRGSRARAGPQGLVIRVHANFGVDVCYECPE
jgi:hypothetical protein